MKNNLSSVLNKIEINLKNNYSVYIGYFILFLFIIFCFYIISVQTEDSIERCKSKQNSEAVIECLENLIK